MADLSNESYIDAKGRHRWRCNDQIAEKLNQLHDLLVIGGYEESHARRYPQLAYTISRHPESILMLYEEDRLSEIPGISKTISGIIGEYIKTGTCEKFEDWAKRTPKTVLELTKINRLGAKTARLLFQEHGIDSLASLAEAIDAGELDYVKGIGKKMKETIRSHIEEHL